MTTAAPSTDGPAIRNDDVSHRYGERLALDAVGFAVARGEIFGLLGPNGGGKTTLFRLLATILPVQSGRATIFGLDVTSQAALVRRRIGVTFQSPGLDGKLTVRENLRHQGHLYGLSGTRLRNRIDELSTRFAVADRLPDRVDTLSGGLKRRVEIAKGLLHAPELLLLDEPSTGLDPGARLELWRHLERLRDEAGTTILVTTHLMDEAERCDRLAILDRGKLVAVDRPDALRREVGGDCLTLVAREPAKLAGRIVERFGVESQRVGATLRIHREAGHELLRDLIAAFGEEIDSVTLGKPTLEDVFTLRTGHHFQPGDEESPETVVATEASR